MSEKPMTELLRKSGIIKNHINEFEKWRLLDPADSKPVEVMIEDLVTEIAEVLENEPIIKQTVLSVPVKAPPRLWFTEEVTFHAVKNEFGQLIIDPRTVLYRGDTVYCEDAVHDNYTVENVEDIYEGDKVVAKMVTIGGLNAVV